MPLPPALLERLKQRKIIQETPKDEPQPKIRGAASSKIDDLQARYGHKDSSKQNPVQNDEQEEIIAADYSDEVRSEDTSDQSDRESRIDEPQDGSPNRSSDQGDYQELSGDEADEQNKDGVCDNQEWPDSLLGCPNKYNIYHECSNYCQEQHGKPELITPTMEQRKQLALILRTFPLPPGWSVVYDPGVKTFYFWDTTNDQVSWFPPAMGSFSTPSANHIRRTMRQLGEQVDD